MVVGAAAAAGAAPAATGAASAEGAGGTHSTAASRAAAESRTDLIRTSLVTGPRTAEQGSARNGRPPALRPDHGPGGDGSTQDRGPPKRRHSLSRNDCRNDPDFFGLAGLTIVTG